MNSWSRIKFDDFVRLKRGYDLPNQLVEDGPYPVVASTSIKTYHRAAKVKGPGVVTGRSGSLGGVQFVRGDFWPLNTTLYVKNFKGNDPRFVSYFLQLMRLEGFNAGAGVPTLNQNHLHKLGISVPQKSVQMKIAGVLSAYDDLIHNNRQRIGLLERIAEQLYREWFVRFRFPGHQHAQFQKGMPADWKLHKLGSILELGYGKSLKEEDRVSGRYPVYGSSGLIGTHTAALVAGPGIIVGRKGNVGSVHWSDSDFFPIDTAYFVKSGFSKFYLFFLLQTMNFINNDAAVPGLSRPQAYANGVLLPPETLIRQFEQVVKPLFELRSVVERQINGLIEARDLLLPRLISGKLRVDDLDIQFPPSMQHTVA